MTVDKGLSFRVEATPHEGIGSKGLSLKVKVRKKQDAGTQYDTILKIKRSGSNKTIHLVQSEQTMTSFDMLVERRKPPEKKKRLFFGSSKPGGCLDPPLDEDNYQYTPTATAKSSSSLDSKTKSKFKKHDTKSVDIKKDEREHPIEKSSSASVLSLFKDVQASSMNAPSSNTIITYPTHAKRSKVSTTSSKKSIDEKRKKSFSQTTEYYFKPKTDDIEAKSPSKVSKKSISREGHRSVDSDTLLPHIQETAKAQMQLIQDDPIFNRKFNELDAKSPSKEPLQTEPLSQTKIQKDVIADNKNNNNNILTGRSAKLSDAHLEQLDNSASISKIENQKADHTPFAGVAVLTAAGLTAAGLAGAASKKKQEDKALNENETVIYDIDSKTENPILSAGSAEPPSTSEQRKSKHEIEEVFINENKHETPVKAPTQKIEDENAKGVVLDELLQKETEKLLSDSKSKISPYIIDKKQGGKEQAAMMSFQPQTTEGKVKLTSPSREDIKSKSHDEHDAIKTAKTQELGDTFEYIDVTKVEEKPKRQSYEDFKSKPASEIITKTSFTQTHKVPYIDNKYIEPPIEEIAKQPLISDASIKDKKSDHEYLFKTVPSSTEPNSGIKNFYDESATESINKDKENSKKDKTELAAVVDDISVNKKSIDDKSSKHQVIEKDRESLRAAVEDDISVNKKSIEDKGSKHKVIEKDRELLRAAVEDDISVNKKSIEDKGSKHKVIEKDRESLRAAVVDYISVNKKSIDDKGSKHKVIEKDRESLQTAVREDISVDITGIDTEDGKHKRIIEKDPSETKSFRQEHDNIEFRTSDSYIENGAIAKDRDLTTLHQTPAPNNELINKDFYNESSVISLQKGMIDHKEAVADSKVSSQSQIRKVPSSDDKSTFKAKSSSPRGSTKSLKISSEKKVSSQNVAANVFPLHKATSSHSTETEHRFTTISTPPSLTDTEKLSFSLHQTALEIGVDNTVMSSVNTSVISIDKNADISQAIIPVSDSAVPVLYQDTDNNLISPVDVESSLLSTIKAADKAFTFETAITGGEYNKMAMDGLRTGSQTDYINFDLPGDKSSFEKENLSRTASLILQDSVPRSLDSFDKLLQKAELQLGLADEDVAVANKGSEISDKDSKRSVHHKLGSILLQKPLSDKASRTETPLSQPIYSQDKVRSVPSIKDYTEVPKARSKTSIDITAQTEHIIHDLTIPEESEKIILRTGKRSPGDSIVSALAPSLDIDPTDQFLVDIAFKFSRNGAAKQTIIKSVDAESASSQLSGLNNIISHKSTTSKPFEDPIELPINPRYSLSLKLNQKHKTPKEKRKAEKKHSKASFDITSKLSNKIQKHGNAEPNIRVRDMDINIVLETIYREQLQPLEKNIKKLKAEIIFLTKEQAYIQRSIYNLTEKRSSLRTNRVKRSLSCKRNIV